MSSDAWQKFQHDSQKMPLQECITASRHTLRQMGQLNSAAASTSAQSSSWPPYCGSSAPATTLEDARASTGKGLDASPESGLSTSSSSESSPCLAFKPYAVARKNKEMGNKEKKLDFLGVPRPWQKKKHESNDALRNNFSLQNFASQRHHPDCEGKSILTPPPASTTTTRPSSPRDTDPQ